MRLTALTYLPVVTEDAADMITIKNMTARRNNIEFRRDYRWFTYQ